MAQLTTRTTSAPGATAKGSPLTNAEVDQNFNRLNKAGPQIRPSLLLDFANSESVDNRITFSRASAATYYDANGVLQTVRNNKPRIDFDPSTGECKGLLIEEQRTNLFTGSDRADTSSWVGTSGGGYGRLVRSVYTIAPDGGLAYKIDSFSACSTYSQQVTVGTGNYTLSFYAKTGSGSGAVGYWVTGVTSSAVGSLAAIQTLSNGWTRYAITINVTVGGAGNFGIHVGCWNSSPSGTQTDWNYYWGFQLEAGSFATSYIPSTTSFTSRASSATYFDSTGVLRIAGTNQPRYGFGYDTTSGKWVSQGLVLEAAATNLLNMQSLFTVSTSYWTINASTAPDGNSTATLLNNAVAPYNWYLTPFSVTSGSTYTFSIFAKAGSSTTFGCGFESGMGNFGIAYFTLSGNGTATPATSAVTASITPVGNGWYRCTVTGTAAASSVTLNVNAANAYAWGMQLEAGDVATSYIPTFGSTATRAADVSSSAATTRGGDNAKLAGANFSSWWNNSAHSVFAEAMTAFAGNDYMIAEGANDSNQIVEMSLTFAGSASAKTQYINRLVSTANDMRSAASAYTANGFVKVAGAGSTSATLGSTSGVSNTSAGNQSSIRNANQMMIGSRQGGSLYLNGCVKKLAFFNKALSQNELNALTQ